jgi:hypothetical protein
MDWQVEANCLTNIAVSLVNQTDLENVCMMARGALPAAVGSFLKLRPPADVILTTAMSFDKVRSSLPRRSKDPAVIIKLHFVSEPNSANGERARDFLV